MKSFLSLPESSYSIRTKAPGPAGALALSEELLLHSPSGDIFGLSQNAGMGWEPTLLQGSQVLILSTLGGLRREDGFPLALGYHTGHWELGLLVKEAALVLRDQGKLPFAAYCTDPCDGRSQGTSGMMDSLPYRNSAAETFGRLIRSLPTCKGLIGIATCDKGHPAMMMALASAGRLPGILIPGGVTLPPVEGEDAGTVQSLGARFSHGEITLQEAAALGCAACATSGGGCQFFGTAATAQVIGEALGMSLPHSALAPSGEPVWFEIARSSTHALALLEERKIALSQIVTSQAIENAMVVHAAMGGSSNLLLHLPAIAYCAGLKRPTVEDWSRINRATPRFVDVLPNGPKNFRTVQLFLAGGVPEVMLQLREMKLLHLDCMTVSGVTLGENLEEWEKSERRKRFREVLKAQDGVNAEEVIIPTAKQKQYSFGSTLIFPSGNLAPEGSVVKSTAIAGSLFNADGVYNFVGPARVFTSEESAIAAVKSRGSDAIKPGEVIILICRGPLAAAMPETAQITIALKYTKVLDKTPLITDGRFSGFSSGPCIGHIGPEALAGGPLGKLRDGDLIEIIIDRKKNSGSINLIGQAGENRELTNVQHGNELLIQRNIRSDLKADPGLPADSKLWAALQQIGGGTWGGCVYDVEKIIGKLQ